jgi:hypothetical protein
LNASGQSQWTLHGIPVSNTTSNAQLNPRVVGDGSGGAVVVWEDIQSFQLRIYAQRMNSAGQRQWPDTGVAVYFYPTSVSLRSVVEDGTGGVFVCWQDQSHTGEHKVFIQHIDGQGNMVWDPFGVRPGVSNQEVNPQMIPDGANGAIIAWEDSSNGIRQVDILAQRVNGAGTRLWGASVTVTDAPNEQNYFSIVPGGNGGAIVVWTDARNWPSPTGLDVYAQSLDGSGNPQWQTNGTPVSQPASQTSQAFPTLVSDNAGGAMAFWEDTRNSGNSTDIYGQGLAALGLPFRLTASISQPNTNYPFVINTTPVVTANFSSLGSIDSLTVSAYLNTPPAGLTKAIPRYVHVSSNGSGFSATLTLHYTDAEVSAARLINRDANLRAYRRSGSVWILTGGTVDTNHNTVTVTGVTEFSEWALRDPSDTVTTEVDVEIHSLTLFQLEQNYPNPFNPSTNVKFHIPNSGLVSLKVFDMLGREVATLLNEERALGSHEVTWDAKGLASGMYFYRLQTTSFVQTKKLVLLR